MNKCLVYLRGGLGDMFPFLSQRDRIKVDFKIDEFVYLFDTAYTQKIDVEAFRLNLISMKELLKSYDITMDNIVPSDVTSAWDLDFHCEGCHVNGPEYHGDDKNMFFGRKSSTKDYILKMADAKECSCVIDVAIPENIFIWKMDETGNFIYSKIEGDNRIVNHPKIDEEKQSYLDNLMKDKHIVVQFGMRGYHETRDSANEYISWLKGQGYRVLVIGFNYGFQFDNNVIDLTNGILSFNEYLYLVEHAEKAMLYSSFFSFYRMYLGNKKTIVYWARHLGSWDNYLYPRCLQNANNTIINSDVYGINSLMDVTNG